MSMLKISVKLAFLWAVAFLFIEVNAQQLGKGISEEDLAPWDISVDPNGSRLPSGSGTAAKGAEVWADNCSACHGEKAEDGPAGALVGGVGSLTSDAPVKTVGSFWPYATTLFDYVRRAMPYHAPGSLSDDDHYAVVAYLLERNGIIDEDDVMSAKTLPKVKMPNHDGFIQYWPSKGD